MLAPNCKSIDHFKFTDNAIVANNMSRECCHYSVQNC